MFTCEDRFSLVGNLCLVLIEDSHGSESILDNIEEIGKSIVARTQRLAGNQKGISTDAIIVKLIGKGLNTMSFLDLPGLTKLPICGQ